jgi:hypothetical protein
VEKEYVPADPAIWGDGHAHIGDADIRAIMEGPFVAFKCKSLADGLVLDYAARTAGTYSVRYRDVYVVMSMGQESAEDFDAFVQRAGLQMSEHPRRIEVSGHVPNQLSECLTACWMDFKGQTEPKPEPAQEGPRKDYPEL